MDDSSGAGDLMPRQPSTFELPLIPKEIYSKIYPLNLNKNSSSPSVVSEIQVTKLEPRWKITFGALCLRQQTKRVNRVNHG